MFHMSAALHQDPQQVDEQSQHVPPVQDAPDDLTPEISSTRNLIFFALLVLIIVLPIRVYVAKPFIVSGASMFPTFNTWHYLIIDQLSYKLSPPERGDVIVFRFPQNPSRFFIKRIIGLPNETVQLSGTTVTIINDEFKNGFVLDEPYVSPENAQKENIVMKLGDDEYFVMGDNRKASADSRSWGPLESYRIIGRAYIRLFPFAELDILPGATTYEVNTQNK